MVRKRKQRTPAGPVMAIIDTRPKDWRFPFDVTMYCGKCRQPLPGLDLSWGVRGAPRVWELRELDRSLWRYDAGVWRPTRGCLYQRAAVKARLEREKLALAENLPGREERADLIERLRRVLRENKFDGLPSKGPAIGSRTLPARIVCPDCGRTLEVPITPSLAKLAG